MLLKPQFSKHISQKLCIFKHLFHSHLDINFIFTSRLKPFYFIRKLARPEYISTCRFQFIKIMKQLYNFFSASSTIRMKSVANYSLVVQSENILSFQYFNNNIRHCYNGQKSFYLRKNQTIWAFSLTTEQVNKLLAAFNFYLWPIIIIIIINTKIYFILIFILFYLNKTLKILGLKYQS